MITVNYGKNASSRKKYTLGELLSLYPPGTAFIGENGNGDFKGVFLMAFDNIIFLDDIEHNWSDEEASFIVDQFVDLEVTIKSKIQ